MMRPFAHPASLVLATLLLAAVAPCAGAETIAEVVDLEPVWSGHPVGFCLLTHGTDQFAAYYDAKRQMTVAHRKLPSGKWTFQKLPRTTKWDSHNYVTMVVDRTGRIHLSGDMHCAELFYLRTERPLDITTFRPIKTMVDPKREQRVTYPVFLRGPDDELLFRYRDGRSGNGNDLYNAYDPKTRTWRPLLATPLTSGQGKRNAYCTRPVKGPDGRFHMVWVWRDTSDAATNHHPSYARSRDLRTWETSAGKKLALPITLATGDVVDPIPPRGGIINGNVRLGFDSNGGPVVTYCKYDSEGNTQIYAARPEDGVWRIRQVSDWKGYRWDFGGGGAIGFEVRVGAVQAGADGTLTLSARNKHGNSRWVLDEKTLRPLPPEDRPKPPAPKKRPKPAGAIPSSVLSKVESTFPGMLKRRAYDVGKPSEANVRYALVWETLGPNRDRPRTGPLPEPSMLRVVKLVGR